MAERWIPVAERLPDRPLINGDHIPSDWVLVATVRRQVFRGHLASHGEEWRAHGLVLSPNEVTHWMPIPDAPEPVNEAGCGGVREVSFKGSTYEVERDRTKVTIYDGGDVLMEIEDPADDCALDGVVIIALSAFYAGRTDGKISGRIELQSELRRLIGAAAAEVAGG